MKTSTKYAQKETSHKTVILLWLRPFFFSFERNFMTRRLNCSADSITYSQRFASISDGQWPILLSLVSRLLAAMRSSSFFFLCRIARFPLKQEQLFTIAIPMLLTALSKAQLVRRNDLCDRKSLTRSPSGLPKDVSTTWYKKVNRWKCWYQPKRRFG